MVDRAERAPEGAGAVEVGDAHADVVEGDDARLGHGRNLPASAHPFRPSRRGNRSEWITRAPVLEAVAPGERITAEVVDYLRTGVAAETLRVVRGR